MLEDFEVEGAYEAMVDRLKMAREGDIELTDTFPDWVPTEAMVKVVSEDARDAMRGLEAMSEGKGKVGITTTEDILSLLATQFHWGILYGLELARLALANEEPL